MSTSAGTSSSADAGGVGFDCVPDSVMVSIAAYLVAASTSAGTSESPMAWLASDHHDVPPGQEHREEDDDEEVEGDGEQQEQEQGGARSRGADEAQEERVPEGETLSMVTRLTATHWAAIQAAGRLGRGDRVLVEGVARSVERHAAARGGRRTAEGAGYLLALKHSCRRWHGLMGTVEFWIEMCRLRHGYFTVPNKDPMTAEETAAMQKEIAEANENAAREESLIRSRQEREQEREEFTAYRHSRIRLPDNHHDKSWWQRLFFDVAHKACDGCNKFPMEVYFKCLHCNDVYLCESCEPTHPRAHLLVKVSTPFMWTQPILLLRPGLEHTLHKGVCSGCATKFGKVLYQCSTCATFKLCPHCKSSSSFPHEHSKFWEVTIPENALYLPEKRGTNPRGGYCDAEGSRCMRVCNGIQWKCLICENYDLCEACEQSREFSCVNTSGVNTSHNLTHPLLKIYDSKFESDKWWLIRGGSYFG
ncbi:hypothetical protein Pelo_8999 [Pelomyxa schiedti]|nr:hypothetical protein Pelo_8999 [Pelomyxa schiedti]